MADYDNAEAMQKAILQKYIVSVQNKVTTHLHTKLREYVSTMYYDTFSPRFYDRSYDLLDSAVTVKAKIVGDRVISEIYFDPDLLKETTFTYEYRDKFGVMKEGKGIRHAWNDKQEIINQTAFGGIGNGIRAANPTIDMSKSGFTYGTPSPENNNLEESYWKSFLEYAFANTKTEIMSELRSMGVSLD